MKHIKKFNENINNLSSIKKIYLMKSIEKIVLEDGQVFFRHSEIGENEQWYDKNDNYVRDDRISYKLEEMYNKK